MRSTLPIHSRPGAAAEGSTLLVFALGPDRDSRRRPLLPARLRPLELELRKNCESAILDAGRSCGMDLEMATVGDTPLAVDVRPSTQMGRTFGERIGYALRDGRQRNPGRPLVLVGGDIAGFSADVLRRTLALLKTDPGSVVVGPSPDGGIYLLASTVPIEDVLEEVTWCRRTTRRSLVRALEQLGRRVHLLAPLADLDRPRDLARLIRRRGSSSVATLLSRILVALLDLVRRLPHSSVLPGSGDYALAHPHRGPPC